MVKLLHLPNELLLGIIDVVRVEDTEAFTACNKRIYSLSQDVLQKYRAMKRKYSTIRIACGAPENLDVRLYVHPMVWLHEIISDETAAAYPTSLYVKDSARLQRWDRGSDPGKVNKLIRNMYDQIYSKLEQCPYIHPTEMEWWKQNIICGPFDAALALLLTLLPNLWSIFIERFGPCLIRTRYMLAKISRAYHANSLGSYALSRLVSIDHLYEAGSMVVITDLEFYLPFIGLPSTRSISGYDVEGRESNHAEYKLLPWWLNKRKNLESAEITSGSKITNIKFTQSKISSQCFQYLLCQISALQDFEYEYAGGRSDGFEPRKIVKCLLAYASHSLLRLDLTGKKVPRWIGKVGSPHDSDVDEEVSRGCVFMGSLRGFQVLKTVRVNHAMFVEKNLRAGTDGQETKVYRLVDLLPASIEKLSLVGELESGPPGHLFDDFVELKAENLPKLEDIKFDSFDSVDPRMKQACHEVGVALSFSTTL